MRDFVFLIIPGMGQAGCYHLGMQTAGFVLVGGKSARMGRDKARLQYDFHLLVEDVARRVGNVAGQVALVGFPERYADLKYEVLPDLRANAGPLGGLEAALASGRGEWNLVAGCDMPELNTDWLKTLLTRAVASTGQCVITRDSTGKVHPLCAMYRACCLPLVQRALGQGRLKLLDLVRELEPQILDLDKEVVNINTPGDWKRWLASRENAAVEAAANSG